MTPEEKQQFNNLINQVKDLNQKLDNLNDLYFRTLQNDKLFLNKPLVLRDTDILIEGKKGLNIGKNALDKMSFYGVTPVVQASGIGNPSGGATQDTQSRTAINQIITALRNIGITA